VTFDLVAIGNPVYDTIVTPYVRTDGRVLSGCSTNACLAAKRLGMRSVGLVGCIGSDFADRFANEMQKNRIRASRCVGRSTGGFHLVYDADGNRTLDILGVADRITRENFPEDFLDARFFLFGPILGEVDLQLLQYVRQSSSAPIFLDPQGLVRVVGENNRVIHRCDAKEFRRIAGLVDFIKPNEPESQTITGENDPQRAIRSLGDLGDGMPILTLAERGSLLLNNGKVHRIPAYPTRALDPTGAGDVYAGAFIVEYMRASDPIEAAIFASAAASIKVEQTGPDFQISREAVLRRKRTLCEALD